MPTPSRRAAALLALLTGAGFLALSGLEPGPVRAAETRFLGWLAASVLLALSALETRIPPVVGGLVLAAAWWLPGVARPAVVVGLLAAATTAALLVGRRPSSARVQGASPFPDGIGLVGTAVALQVLTSSERLLDPSTSELLVDVFGPLLPIALAAPALARRKGPGVLLGLVALAVLGPGIGWVGGLTLAGLALAGRRDGLRWLAPIVPWTSPAALGVGGSLAVGLGLLEQESRRLRIAVGVLTAVVGGVAVSVTAGPSAVLYPVLLISLLAAALVAPSALTLAGGGLLLLGASLVDVVHGAPTASLLAPGVLLIAWTIDPRRPLAGTLLFAIASGTASVIAASYPWHRAEPLEAALAGWAPHPGTRWILVVGLGAAVLDRWASPRLGRAAVALALVAGAIVSAPRVERVLLDEQPVVLTAERPIVEFTLPAGTGLVVVDTQATNAQSLPSGRRLAALWIREPEGPVLRRLGIEIGEETGEWAAGRPDLRATVPAPEPWSERVAASGDFFSQRYRARWWIDPPDHDLRLQIRRLQGLSPQTRLVVHRIEARAEGSR